MPVFELYSKRRKTELKAGQPDVFQYERVSAKLRTQLVHVWRDAIGTKDAYQYDPEVHWAAVHKVLTREKGLQYLVSHARRYRQACEEWFQDVANDEDALDLIEVVAVLIDGVLCRLDDHGRKMRNIELSAAAALAEMNYRFRENDLGFQYENGVLVRLDSQYVHANITKPALALLCAEPFGKANDDFMNAHKHYRAGDHKACVVACQRAFESVLKAICEVHGWTYAPGDRASELISVVRKNGLFPNYLGKSFDTYVAMMKSGLPDVRNNAGGHGEAPSGQPVPAYIAAYALHLSATNIVMVVEASNSLTR